MKSGLVLKSTDIGWSCFVVVVRETRHKFSQTLHALRRKITSGHIDKQAVDTANNRSASQGKAYEGLHYSVGSRARVRSPVYRQIWKNIRNTQLATYSLTWKVTHWHSGWVTGKWSGQKTIWLYWLPQSWSASQGAVLNQVRAIKTGQTSLICLLCRRSYACTCKQRRSL